MGEELASVRTSRAILMHSSVRPLPELATLLCASIVLHFPQQRPSRTEVEHFQRALIATVREGHPDLWAALSDLESLDEKAAAATVQKLGETILAYRFDFSLTRPEL